MLHRRRTVLITQTENCEACRIRDSPTVFWHNVGLIVPNHFIRLSSLFPYSGQPTKLNKEVQYVSSDCVSTNSGTPVTIFVYSPIYIGLQLCHVIGGQLIHEYLIIGLRLINHITEKRCAEFGNKESEDLGGELKFN